MKVLWFTNSPSLAAVHLNLPVTGLGWIKSLEAGLIKNESIELAVAFKHGEEKLEKITTEKTIYYAMPQQRKKGIVARAKGFIARHRNVLDDAGLINYCTEVINDFKPDIINIFGTEYGFGLICDKTDVPVVIHIQGNLTVYERKWFSAGISKWDIIKNSGINDLFKANSILHDYKREYKNAALREQVFFRNCKYFMGRTDWDRRLTAALSSGGARYFHCEEALREDFFVKTWQKETRGEKVFLSTIQAKTYKGLETILETAILLKRINKFPFKWQVAGIPADDLIVKIFERKIGKKFSDYNIVLRGRLTAAELIEAQLDADIFIHPSHIDNSPNSVCEAMLLGMPVIATFTGGTGSLLKDNEEGILLQDGDPYAMAGAVMELANDPARAARLGKAARERALRRHNPDTIVKELIGIYSQIVKKSI
jgi:glycosyltransferase involved in cell wall biosynthesis